jgi:hypothetical protein
MLKNYQSLLAALSISALIVFIFYTMMPQDYSRKDQPLNEFSTERALKHVKEIAQNPHFIGSENHLEVKNYLVSELEKLGLEVQIQESAVLSKWNNLVETQNILARIKGSDSKKSLLLLSHYDSAPHTKSLGASDDANGLATILEGIRAFLHQKAAHKNDIVILFSDAEEVGLNGAYAFATEHPWAKEVGLVINFEARGSDGPSMMLAETEGGNAQLIKAFSKAGTTYPVSNSLMCSIYKMLPNDTDLTAFREKAAIPGYNFAYIDDHFDYHTVQDNYENFTPECLEHQASYLMPMLTYFSNSDLTKIKSKEDQVYFNIPFGFIHYPYSWNLPLLIIAFVLFFTITIIGLGKHVLDFKEVIRGFLPLFGSLIISIVVAFFGWKMIQSLYPEYQDILHSFPYNGHTYIFAFVFLTLSICFWIYSLFIKSVNVASYSVAPLFTFLVINLFLLIILEGASFFIIPFFFALLNLGLFVYNSKANWITSLLITIPVLFIFVPFIPLFPIGLGLKMLAGSAFFIVLVFSLMLLVLGKFSNKNGWGWLFFILAFVFFIMAHFQSGFEKEKGKPNSLVYILEANTNKSYWATYDKVLDSWTKKHLTENPKSAKKLNKNTLTSKYNSGFSFMAEAPSKNIPAPSIRFSRDTIVGNYRAITLEIKPNRNVNRIDVFMNENIKIHNLWANGTQAINQKGSFFVRKDSRVINYYPIQNKPLILQFQLPKEEKLQIEIMTSSFDLLENELFKIPQRPSEFIPMPFVLNDAIVVKKKFFKAKSVIKTPLEQGEQIIVIDSTLNESLDAN